MNLNDAQRLALALMHEHNLLVRGWKFEFDRSVRRFGCCRYGSRKITLSRQLVHLNDEARVRNTILHEIAHALTPGAGHGRVWKAMAKAIGCIATRCYDSSEINNNLGEAVRVKAKYVGTCPSGRHTIRRHRVTDGMRGMSCGQCCPVYNVAYKFTWSPALPPVPMKRALMQIYGEIEPVQHGPWIPEGFNNRHED